MDKILQHFTLEVETSNRHTVESMPNSKMAIPTPLEGQVGPKRPESRSIGAGWRSDGVAEFCQSTEGRPGDDGQNSLHQFYKSLALGLDGDGRFR